MRRFCQHCGKQVKERSRFCPKCGKNIPARRTSAVETEDGVTATYISNPTSDMDIQYEMGAAAYATVAETTHGSGRMPETTVYRHPSESRVHESSEYQQQFAPPTHSFVGTYEQAGFGLRYGAWMFDFLITLIATMAFTFIVSALSKRSVVGSNQDLVIVALLTVGLVLLNFLVLAGRTGQSIGMRILGIRIVRLDGKPFTTKAALIRHFVGYPLSTFSFFFGFLWMLWDPKQQGWHDKLSGTIVVMTR